MGTGKAVDSTDPIMPVQMPRGYVGVGMLWKKDDHNHITVYHYQSGETSLACLCIYAM